MKYELNLVSVARQFAEEAHGDQKYDNMPYTNAHLDKVVHTLTFFTNDPVVLAMGYLHDVLEDTSVTYDELAKTFGHVIANGVLALTDQKGNSRFERQFLTYVRLRDNREALLVKLCDRITNMRASFGTKHAAAYVKEYERFKGSLYVEDDLFEGAWIILDSLYNGLLDESKK